MNEYPKFLYGADGSKLVRNAAEEAALAGTWCDSPEKVPMLKTVDETPNADQVDYAEPEAGSRLSDLMGLESDERSDSAPAKRGRPFKNK